MSTEHSNRVLYHLVPFWLIEAWCGSKCKFRCSTKHVEGSIILIYGTVKPFVNVLNVFSLLLVFVFSLSTKECTRKVVRTKNDRTVNAFQKWRKWSEQCRNDSIISIIFNDNFNKNEHVYAAAMERESSTSHFNDQKKLIWIRNCVCSKMRLKCFTIVVSLLQPIIWFHWRLQFGWLWMEQIYIRSFQSPIKYMRICVTVPVACECAHMNRIKWIWNFVDFCDDVICYRFELCSHFCMWNITCSRKCFATLPFRFGFDSNWLGAQVFYFSFVSENYSLATIFVNMIEYFWNSERMTINSWAIKTK